MKKILLFVLGLSTAAIILFAYQYSSRATSSQLLLAKITYNTDVEFETAFDGSTSVHYFYEQPTTTDSYMISQLTTEQYDKLTSMGFIAQILETAPEMSNYLVVYTPQDVPASSLSVMGTTQELDDHFTLVKTQTEEQSLNHDSLAGPDIAVFVYDIEKPLLKPLYKTVRIESEYE